MGEKNVVFNEDQKAHLLEVIKKLHQVNGQLYGWVEKDELPEQMASIFPSLMESHFSDIARVLGYESHLLKEKEKRHEEIREANIKIQELEKKIGSERAADGLKEQLKHLYEVVRNWWNTEGFHHTSEESYYPYGGLKIQFHFMLDHYRSYSKTPVTDERTKQEQIQNLRDKGYAFADFEEGSSEKLKLIDNPHNRKLLTEMLRERFPSIEIHSWRNTDSYKDPDQYVIRYIDASIRDLTDI